MFQHGDTGPERRPGHEAAHGAASQGAAETELTWRRDPIAWLLVLLGFGVAAYSLWWALGLGNSSVGDRFTAAAALPSGLLVVYLCIRMRSMPRIDANTSRMWSLIAIAVLSYGLGALLHVLALAIPSLTVLAPVVFVLELATYPVLWFALALMPGPSYGANDITLFALDVAIVTWSAAILLWHFVLYPAGRIAGADVFATFGAAVFPSADLSLVFALGALLTRVEQIGTQRAFAIAAVATALIFFGDVVSGIQGLFGTYEPGGVSGVFYAAAWVGLGCAAYVQFRAPDRRRHTFGLSGYARSVPYLPYVAVAVAFLAPTVRDWNDIDLLRQHLPATGLLIALVIARLAVTARENVRLATADRARLAAAVDQAAEAMITTDLGGTVTYVNPAFTRITGYTAAESIGKTPEFLRRGADPEALARIVDAFAKGESWAGRLVAERRDGAAIEVALTIAPLRDAAGAVSGAIAVGRDISHERALEAQLAQAQRMEAVGRLAGGVAHDFNNILTAINGFGELAVSELPADHPVADDLREILKAADRAASLTSALLAFSRRTFMQRRMVDLNDVVAGLTPMLAVLLGESVELEIQPDPELGLSLIDRAVLEQVILNLAVNARDAMPGGGKLTIGTANAELDAAYARTHVGAVPGPHVTLSISDTGTGMTPEVMEHAFEPFFTTKARGKGTGLGLSTVIGLVTQSLGTVEVASVVGRGTSFTIVLPRLAGTSEPPEAEAAKERARGGNETILVAEDEDAVRLFVERVLKRAGYRVLTASNGQEALAVAETIDHLDLLFTDMVMPAMGGPELARALTALHPHAPTLYGSGYSDEALVEGFGHDAQVPYLAKPFTADRLLSRVREVLDAKAESRRAAGPARKRRPGKDTPA
jgi:PAS domain S-box-containing protein